MAKRRTYIVTGVVVSVLVLVWAINFFIYPFRADNPNFSDVERVFNRIQIPNDWQLIEQTENRGRFGRTCPLESSGCFSKAKKFRLPGALAVDDVAGILKSGGCESVAVTNNSKEGQDLKKYRLVCSTGEGVIIGSDLDYDDQELFISVRTN